MSPAQIITDLQQSNAAISLCELADDACCRLCLVEIQQARADQVRDALRRFNHEFALQLMLSIICKARRESTEGQIWPAVRTGLNLSAQVSDLLFQSNGQPRVEVKTLIERTCRRLRLRHIFGQDGTQEWFGSIYLQFGFTQRGFVKMLPEWLMGYNQPNTIARLLDDPELKSLSFRKLWEALLSFRRGNAVEAVTRRIISESPWVLPDWTDELLVAAKKKPHLSPASYRSSSGEAGEAPRTFLSEPHLIVGSQLADAQWQIELAGLAEWDLKGTSFCVCLRCGESPTQEIYIRKQADGTFSNLMHTFEFPLTGLRESLVSASITDQQGREVAAQDIHLFDPDADILAFSERGYLDDGFVKRGPRTSGAYFILVRVGLNLFPQPADWHLFEVMGYKLHRLSFEAGQKLQVLFEDGEELWSNLPQSSGPAWTLSFNEQLRCNLATISKEQAFNPDVKYLKIEIAGLGQAKLKTARWRSIQLQIANDHCFEGNGQNWGDLLGNAVQALGNGRMPASIKVPKFEALLAQKLMLNLAINLGDHAFRTKVECHVLIPGILEKSCGKASFGEFFTTRNNEQLKRWRYTIIPTPPTDEQLKRGFRWRLFEGDRFVSELREGSPQSLHDLGGYGQSLSIRLGQFNQEEKPTVLIGEVADRGLFQIRGDVNPFIGKDYTFDAWGTPEMGDEHSLFYGSIHERATTEAAGQRLVFADDKAMFAPFPDQTCDYLVLAYAGVRLATWWRVPHNGSSWSSNLAEIRDDVDARRAAFTIRWAKLPILSSHHYHHVKEFFHRFPHIVLGQWLCYPKERKDGRRIEGENTEAWHDAVRVIIQGYQIDHAQLTTEQKQKLIQCLPSLPTDDENAKTLDTFQAVGTCDPVLMGRMIRWWKQTGSAQGAAGTMRALLLHGSESNEDLMSRLQYDAPGVDDGFLRSVIDIGVKAVSGQALDERCRINLKSALTIKSFRRALYRRIVEHYLP